MSDERTPDRVLYLASVGKRPRPACTTCLHYHPRTDSIYGKVAVSWHWSWPWRRVSVVHDSGSFYHGICSFYGGHTASNARDVCGGEEWEPKE